MSKKDFKLKFDDQGNVRYIIRAGRDLVLAKATTEQAEWMMKNKPITRSTPTDWPDFSVCAGGDYWFEGEWEDTSSALRAPSTQGEGYSEPSIFADEGETERPIGPSDHFPTEVGKQSETRKTKRRE